MSTEVAEVLQDLYYDERSARALLLRIGFPPSRIPAFHAAGTFWIEVVLQLDRGVLVDGTARLLAEVARDHPGNPVVGRLAARGDGREPLPVLALFSDPVRASRIRIDREARQLQELAAVGTLEITMRYATRVRDIVAALRQVQPRILHFAGHGLRDGHLVFEDDEGGAARVGVHRLADAIAATVDPLECVVLNSCWTGTDAEAFRPVSRAVAGSVDALPDDTALAFSRGFYHALADGEPVGRAFGQGRAEAGLLADTTGLHLIVFAAGPATTA